jgi:hypothetical protein
VPFSTKSIRFECKDKDKFKKVNSRGNMIIEELDEIKRSIQTSQDK